MSVMKKQKGYDAVNRTFGNLNGQLEIPKFQRAYVWKDKQKEELISTLSKGYPFGALLTYYNSTSEKEMLLDGQQRWRTITDYNKRKVHYFCKLQPDNYNLEMTKLKNYLEGSGMNPLSDKEFMELANKNESERLPLIYAKLYNDHSGKAICEHVASAFREFDKQIDSFLDIDNLEIPVIKYLGSEADIAEIFKNINRGGMKLKKFEIFAAAWADQMISLKDTPIQEELLTDLKKYYLEKRRDAEGANVELSAFSEDEFTRERKINLYELGLGLGMLIRDRAESFLDQKSMDDVNAIGFGVLAIGVDLPSTALDEMPSKIVELQNNDNLERILKRAINISEQLNAIFGEIVGQYTGVKVKGIEYHQALFQTYKILSYYAALWNLDDNRNDEKRTLKNIPSYLVFHYIAGRWGNAGDTELNKYYPKNHQRNYLDKIDKAKFKAAFKDWLVEKNNESTNFKDVTKALLTIYANYTYMKGPSSIGEPYEFEHIYPKQRVRQLDEEKLVTLGRLGNGMYLPKKDNNKKKTKTLYEVDNPEDYTDIIKKSLYPSQAEMDKSWRDLEQNNTNTINESIKLRSEKIIDALVERLVDSNFAKKDS